MEEKYKKSVRLEGIPIEIRTQLLPNTSIRVDTVLPLHQSDRSKTTDVYLKLKKGYHRASVQELITTKWQLSLAKAEKKIHSFEFRISVS
jgi:hypothetical protein